MHGDRPTDRAVDRDRPSEATHGQASVCAERRCTADLQTLSSGPHSAVTAQIALASDARTYFVPAGSATVSLPPRLCTWLPGFRSSARVTPQRILAYCYVSL